jgi:hypothetical protein
VCSLLLLISPLGWLNSLWEIKVDPEFYLSQKSLVLVLQLLEVSRSVVYKEKLIEGQGVYC